MSEIKGRPKCFEFAMTFVGGSDEEEVRAYVEGLEVRLQRCEAALQQIASDPCLDPEGNADIARKALLETGSSDEGVAG